MLSERQRKVLFILYFLITVVLPTVIFIVGWNDWLKITKDEAPIFVQLFLFFVWLLFSVILSGGESWRMAAVLGVLYVAGWYEWKRMPVKLTQILSWFTIPFLVFLISVLVADSKSLLETFRINGIVIILSTFVALFLTQIKFVTPILARLKSLNHYKNLTLQSKINIEPKTVTTIAVVVILAILFLLIITGSYSFIWYIIKFSPYPQNLYTVAIFAFSTISNVVLFYKTQASNLQYES